MRVEKDSMGEMEVPEDALYGASTQRAVLNFEISSLRFPEDFISALGVVKYAAALANFELGLLPKDKSDAIAASAREVIEGKLNSHFVIDIFQTGSGTSTNMNANEVIANRATELLGGKRGDKNLIHPNDHVNMCQSSNDVIPTAINIAAGILIVKKLIPSLEAFKESLKKKEKEFSSIIKAGRTHLQDATPITVGQEFSAFAAQVEYGIRRILTALESLSRLALGGTAVGTGINTHPQFPAKAIEVISQVTGLRFCEARNHFEAQATQDTSVEASGALRTFAVSLMKIANDIRWLSAGPRCNLSELRLPAIQPGSSIMPGKVNPVICEAVMQVSAKVIGNDACITTAAQHGNFELNTMMPVIAYCFLESIELLSSACDNFRLKCIDGISANREKCEEYAEKSLATCTSLAPIIGYDRAVDVANKAMKEGKTIREIIDESGLGDDERVRKALDLTAMTRPGI